ncbi:hypothetical protein Q5P01_015279 [Channa striata]|uniref:Uncharacterized protein n=1 Tax=Channa striata TaxID=64152 RepID=A0AA88MKC8_CHASR|nr:hypothetical protein Q5P01_015279 [Channa striata]
MTPAPSWKKISAKLPWTRRRSLESAQTQLSQMEHQPAESEGGDMAEGTVHLPLSVCCRGPAESCLVSFQQFSRCPHLQTHRVLCPILALLRGRVYPRVPSWALALDRTPHQALFTV